MILFFLWLGVNFEDAKHAVEAAPPPYGFRHSDEAPAVKM